MLSGYPQKRATTSRPVAALVSDGLDEAMSACGEDFAKVDVDQFAPDEFDENQPSSCVVQPV